MIRVLALSTLAVAGVASAQMPNAAQLAESDRCREALPLLKKAISAAADPAQKNASDWMP